MSIPRELSLTQFYSPRYAGTWLVWLAMQGIARLPVAAQVRAAKRLGRLLGAVKRKQRAIAQRNLHICFPELSTAQRRELLMRNFESIGASFAETALGWFAPIERLRGIVHLEGSAHLERALARGKGAILLTAHFTSLEVCAAILQDLPVEFACMYRPQRNRMMDVMIRRGRSRFAAEQIPRDNVRGMLRNLRQNRAVIYLPDQTHLGKQSELLPFFGEMALTNIATSKLAKLSGAPVLPYFFRRLPDDASYAVTIGAPLADFPSTDPVEDTRRLVALLEQQIRRVPEQYLWTYRKFKGRPKPYPDLYEDASRVA